MKSVFPSVAIREAKRQVVKGTADTSSGSSLSSVVGDSVGGESFEESLNMSGDDEIFVKRVDFEVNNNKTDPISAPIGKVDPLSDVEKSAELEKKETCTSKFCTILDKFGIKSALSHIALLASLGAWCFIGGWVNTEQSRLLFIQVNFLDIIMKHKLIAI